MKRTQKDKKDKKWTVQRQSVQVHLGDTIALQSKDFDKNLQSREINDDNEEEVAPKAKR